MKHAHLTLLCLVFLLMLSKYNFGQTVEIYGKITGPEQEEVVGVAVMLLSDKDSTLKTYAITTKTGEFELSKVKPGNYVLKTAFVGFVPYNQSISITDKTQDIDLGQIQLQSKIMDAVVVTGQYIPVQLKGDSLEYDPRAFKTGEHAVIEDLLKQLPGIEVETDGTILFQGKKVEKVLIDGETFFGDDPKIASKNLSAEAVRKIQIFDKSSEISDFTGNDDGSESLTINLKLKDDFKKGYFGSLLVASGLQYPVSTPIRHKVKGNYNYFKNNWKCSVLGMTNNVNETNFSLGDNSSLIGDIRNFSGSAGSGDGLMNSHGTGVSFSYRPSRKTTFNSFVFLKKIDKTFVNSVERETYLIDSVLFTSELNNNHNGDIGTNGNIYFRQILDSSHFISLSANASWNVGDILNNSEIINTDENNILFSSFKTDFAEDRNTYTVNSNLKYRKNFKKQGRNTGLNLSYTGSGNDNQSLLIYLNSLVTNGIINETTTDQVQNTRLITSQLSTDYMWDEPLDSNQTLQLHLKYQNHLETRDKTVYDNINGVSTFNNLLSANGDYRQSTTKAEVRHKIRTKLFFSSIGASYARLVLSGDQIFETPRYFDYLLPDISIRWKRSLKTTFKLSYNANYSAPNLHQLQPLPNNTNPLEITLGNTELTPEMNHNIRLSFRNYSTNKQSFFSASISGSLINNNIVFSQNINAFFIKEIIPENLGQEKSINSNLAYGSQSDRLKLKFRLSKNTSVSNGIVNLNGVQDNYTQYQIKPSLTLDNLNKNKLDLRASVNYVYTINEYAKNSSFNNSFHNLVYFGSITVKLQEVLIINTNVNHSSFIRSTSINHITIFNFHAGLNLLKSKNMQIYLSAKDLLNQNTGINQTNMQNTFEQTITQNLGRYAIVGLKYKFN